jgi:hypothetical protein
MYEFTTVVVLVAVVAYTLLAVRAPELRHIGVFIMGPVVVAMALIRLVLYVQAGPLVAALRSWWLAVHVTTATLGFGIFFVSGIVSVLYLVKSRREERIAAGAVPAPSLLDRLPSAAALDRTAHRGVRLPDLDLRGHRRGHLGGERLGPVLGLGPEGDLGLHRLGRLRRLPARPDDVRLAGPPVRVGQRGGARGDGLQPAVRQLRLHRAAQLRRGQLRKDPAAPRHSRARGGTLQRGRHGILGA